MGNHICYYPGIQKALIKHLIFLKSQLEFLLWGSGLMAYLCGIAGSILGPAQRLRIQCCPGCGIGHRSDLIPVTGTSIFCRYGRKRKKKIIADECIVGNKVGIILIFMDVDLERHHFI